MLVLASTGGVYAELLRPTVALEYRLSALNHAVEHHVFREHGVRVHRTDLVDRPGVLFLLEYIWRAVRDRHVQELMHCLELSAQ